MNRHASLPQLSQRLLVPLGIRISRITTHWIHDLDLFLDLEWLVDHQTHPVIFDIVPTTREQIHSILA